MFRLPLGFLMLLKFLQYEIVFSCLENLYQSGDEQLLLTLPHPSVSAQSF